MLCIYSHVGPGSDVLDGQTKSRCQRALTLHHQYPDQSILIAVAIKQQGELVGEVVKRYLIERGVPAKQIIFQPGGYTTVDETNTFLAIIRQHHPQPPAPITVISTWYHLPRIYWLWLARGQLVRVAAVWKGASVIDLILEPPKLLINLLLPFYVPHWLRG